MNQKSIKNLRRLLSFSEHQFGILYKSDKFTQNAFDTIITDIDSSDLHGGISNRLKKKYLSPLSSQQEEFQTIRNGLVCNLNLRGMISIPTRFRNKTPIWIHYLIGTGAPYTFITEEAMKVLVGPEILFQDYLSVYINEMPILVGRSSHHYETVNLLGMDFLMRTKQMKFSFQQSGLVNIKIEFQRLKISSGD